MNTNAQVWPEAYSVLKYLDALVCYRYAITP